MRILFHAVSYSVRVSCFCREIVPHMILTEVSHNDIIATTTTGKSSTSSSNYNNTNSTNNNSSTNNSISSSHSGAEGVEDGAGGLSRERE
jgi:hypothetical protein